MKRQLRLEGQAPKRLCLGVYSMPGRVPFPVAITNHKVREIAALSLAGQMILKRSSENEQRKDQSRRNRE